MPNIKQPRTLADAAVRTVANVAQYACIVIEERHGKFQQLACQREIKALRDYFLENIGHFFEDMCSEITRSRLMSRFPTDPRILVAFLFHENKRNVNLRELGCKHEYASYLTSSFWAEQLGKMKNITYLDISEIDCSDEIIKTVSNVCTKLEKLSIMDSYETLTDEGLLYLTNCSNLLILIDYKQFRRFAQTTIRELITSLTKLVTFNYLHMGELLCNGFEGVTLPLLSVAEEKARSYHIKTIIKVCPSLRHLSLSQDASNDNDIMTALAGSNLRLQTLDLSSFALMHVTPVLRERGKYLHTLKLVFPRLINAKSDIILIGLTCPTLKYLSLVTSGSIAGTDFAYNHQMPKKEKKEIFLCLKSLKLCINASDFDVGIPQLILNNAEHINDILFIINNATDACANLHDVFAEILTSNKMAYLNRLRITGLCFISSSAKAVELIFHRLINLKQLVYISKMNAEVVSYFNNMDTVIYKNNLNLRLFWSDLTDLTA